MMPYASPARSEASERSLINYFQCSTRARPGYLFRRAVWTCFGSPQVMNVSPPECKSRGYPRAILPPSATCTTGPAAPAKVIWRASTRAAPPPVPCSSQDTMAPESSRTTDVYPKECPVLTVVGFVKAEPLSLENAISVLGASCAEVNQDIATVSPDAATEAAWVGQALIFQLSAYKFLGCDQCPFSKRRTEISRISSAVGPR